MCDTSNYTIEQRIIASTWVHERDVTGKSITDIKHDFMQRFQRPCPGKMTLTRWAKKLFTTGCIKDKKRTGRQVIRKRRSQEIVQSINDSPKKSIRKRSAELGIPRSTLHKHMKLDLKLHPYHPMCVNELSDQDLERRQACCAALLNKFDTIPIRGKVFFSDECAIYRSNKPRNVYFWSKENPYYFEELEHNPPHVMIWAAVSSRHIIGPYFFDHSVNQNTYLRMLQDWFIPKLRELNIENNCYFQQDGAPPHYSLLVRDYLNKTFGTRWIGRGSDILPAPMNWPPRSPDLSTCDNALWGFIKEQVAKRNYRTTDELKGAVLQAFTQITQPMLRRMSHRTWRRIILCRDNNGVHTDRIDM